MDSGTVVIHKNDKSSYIGKLCYNNIQCDFNYCVKKNCSISVKNMKL
jgi:hypothetical protein